MIWHNKNTEDVISELKSSPKGLSVDEARRRLETGGFNELEEKGGISPLTMFLNQFKDFMIIVLMGSAVVAGIAGKPVDAAAIMAIVILNAIIGFIQEFRAEKAMAALKMMAAPLASVLRDGAVHTIPAREIVTGDMIIFEAGQVVPADMRLIEVATLKIEEAALTGESVPAEKSVPIIGDEFLPLGDRRNMAYQGTVITYGRGKGVVVATGMNTELGKIAAQLQQEKETKTPLQERLALFGKKLAIAILVICAVVFAAGLLRGEQPMMMFLTAVSLAVAAIPEALPAVITISLALGAKKMVKQNALMRKLAAVETLGSVTYICSDKTGTLTQNKMTVEEIYVNNTLVHSSQFLHSRTIKSSVHSKDLTKQRAEDEGQGDVRSLLATCNLQLDPGSLLMTALALSNDAHKDATGKIIGDPTEVALSSVAFQNGFNKSELKKKFPRVEEIPFDSERKCMTTFHKAEGQGAGSKGQDNAEIPTGVSQVISFTKGAIEIVLEKADSVYTSECVVPIDRETIHQVSDRMAADGLRVLGIAIRTWDAVPADLSAENVETKLILLGLVGMMDPPREEAKEAVALCKTAGIRPVMITGDHPLTARAIAKRLGMIDDLKSITSGRELERMPLDEFAKHVEHISVYARVAPEQKLKIVQALQDRGQFVAMTGDGVNDAPALKRSNIGVAMGITGTDVAKEASSMILLDDNFATIVKAVKEGRRIYDNILKFIKYTMTSNAGTLWAVFLAPFFGLPLPMIPIQILWMNLLCDSLPGLALTAEPAERGIMQRPPRAPNEGVFDRGRGTYIIKFGLVIGVTALLFQKYAMVNGMHWQTMIFSGLVIGRMAVVSAVRSDTESLFKTGIFSNIPLFGAILLIIALQCAVIYLPALNPVFGTAALSGKEMGLTFGFASVVFIVVEAEKLWRRWRRAPSGA